MKITSIADAPKVPSGLDGCIMHNSPELVVINLCLQPGQVIARHPNQYDVVACLVAGKVILHIGEKNIELTLFDTVEIKKNAERGFTNNGNVEARLLMLKKL